MQAFAKTDIGCVRKVNQDTFFCSTEPVGPLPNLFIVADGMGGHNAGDFASKYAIETFLDEVRSTQETNLIQIVSEAVQTANRRVLEKSLTDPALARMGTTMVAAVIDGDTLYVSNVGDSRLYLISSEINQVTEDHSYVADLLRAHELTREEARNHPRKNIITRAIGVTTEVRADFFEVDLEAGDRILMCSDGLSNMIEDPELFEIIRNHDISSAI
ncbi:MAG: Stp1/IreP family PP2C-type Ser/Thr phosphatase, partial [bacterium]